MLKEVLTKPGIYFFEKLQLQSYLIVFFQQKNLFLIFRIRSMSRDKSGVRDPEQRKKIKKMDKKMQKKTFAKMGKAGESDRHIAVKMPRHLFSGKRGSGKTDRR